MAEAPRGMPAQIGKYRIIDRIGRGAMGVVYSAQDEVMGRQVGLKVLVGDLESDPETRARFHREAKAAARLIHQNIITVFDAGEDQGRLFIAMELLQGSPLKGYLKESEAAPLERKLDLMIQMCEGLAAAHGQGIVHRDLKPSNLFVQSNGLLKILDFGIARFVDSSMTAVGTLLGTPDYMSPEQARGGVVDARSDIFSAGAVIYFVLTGRKPFPGANMPTVLRQLQFEPPSPFGDGVPQELQELVLRCMAKKVEERPSRVEDLLAMLVRFQRQYLSETRRLMMTARARDEEVQWLFAAVVEAAAAIGAPAAEPIAEALQAVHERLPSLAGRSPESVGQQRSQVAAVVDELTQLRDQLSHELMVHRRHAARLEEGERARAAGNAREALRAFEDVLAASPASARARQLAESARPVAAEQTARERVAADAAETLRQASDDEIRRARSVFRRGRYDEAVQQLRGLLEVEPDSAQVEKELAHLIALRETIAQGTTAARRSASELRSRAAALAQSGDAGGALGLARQALQIDATDRDAAVLVDQLLARQLEARLAQTRQEALDERAGEAEPLMTAARAARARGYPQLALNAALTAQAVAPHRTDIAAFVDETRVELASEDRALFDLSAPAAAPPMPRHTPRPGQSEASPADGRMLKNWAADLLRAGLRRGKA